MKYKKLVGKTTSLDTIKELFKDTRKAKQERNLRRAVTCEIRCVVNAAKRARSETLISEHYGVSEKDVVKGLRKEGFKVFKESGDYYVDLLALLK